MQLFQCKVLSRQAQELTTNTAPLSKWGLVESFASAEACTRIIPYHPMARVPLENACILWFR